jgi:hypothetical protein
MMLVLTGASQVPARDDATTYGGALKKTYQSVPPAMAAKWMRAPIALRKPVKQTSGMARFFMSDFQRGERR